MQKLRLTGTDVFYEINDMRTDDGGKTWCDPVAHKETLGRRAVSYYGVEEAICDFWPAWHAKTGVLPGTGMTERYKDDNIHPHPRPRKTIYSVYDPDGRTWAPWKRLDLPDRFKFYNEGAGSTQRVDLPNGEILLPTYFIPQMAQDEIRNLRPWEGQWVSTVMRCGFDGNTLTYIEHGTELTVPDGSGFCEPSLAYAGGRYFLTLRNDHAAYVAVGADGLHFERPQWWTFDDGTELGNYNTQQHWLTHGDDLYLVYNRQGANNDHVFRHRAPLFIAQIDKDRLCVIRETERILVPERGARLGNFGVTQATDNETWVVVSEWMQIIAPNNCDPTICEKCGSGNSIFLAKLRWSE